MTGDAEQDKTEWSRDSQKLAVLTWISFLSAAVFSVLLFAYVDPLWLIEEIDISGIETRNGGYAIGFFFLWLQAWSSGWLILRLVRRKRNWPRRP